MQKLVIKIIGFFLLCIGTVFAQQVSYLVTDNKNDPKNSPSQVIVLTYKSNGSYDGKLDNKDISFEITDDMAISTYDKTVLKQKIKGPYWHDRVGMWRSAKVELSVGDKIVKEVVAKMLYIGIVPSGRKYREEIWINKKLFSVSDTIIDSSNRMVSTQITTQRGTSTFTRLGRKNT